MSANFIKLISELHFQRFDVHVSELIGNKTPCGIFFGFSGSVEIVKMTVQKLQQTGLNISCVCVISEDIARFEKMKEVPVPVIALDEFDKFGDEKFNVKKPDVIFIPDLIKDLTFVPYFTRHGMESLSPLGLNTQTPYFMLMMQHLPELYSVYSMFDDEESKKTYRAAIKGRLTGKMSDYNFATEPQYFLEGFTPQKGDIAIDGGSFDGGTSATFAKCGAEVYAFEADEVNYKNCFERAEKFGFTIENYGLSDKEKTVGYDHVDYNPAGSHISDTGGGGTAKLIDLDTYVKRKNLPRIDYIKLDIEGSELDMLHGAAETVSRCKPKMAISAYHKPEDMWTLATYIKSIRPDYEFQFRHYGIDFSDYVMNDPERAVLDRFNLPYLAPNHGEYVLYCR